MDAHKDIFGRHITLCMNAKCQRTFLHQAVGKLEGEWNDRHDLVFFKQWRRLKDMFGR